MTKLGTFSAIAIAALMVWVAVAQEEKPAEDYPQARSFDQDTRKDVVGRRIMKSRSFFGAPPPIPHSLKSEIDPSYCLQCHAQENRIEKRHQAIAPVPHAEFSQCTQCHVRGDRTDVELFAENRFVGLDFPGPGDRANQYAPPTVPHKTFMRENCQSCHGPMGKYAIRTPHPERSQCSQCHVPDASKNYTSPLDWMTLRGLR